MVLVVKCKVVRYELSIPGLIDPDDLPAHPMKCGESRSLFPF